MVDIDGYDASLKHSHFPKQRLQFSRLRDTLLPGHATIADSDHAYV
jgi:hypothetical protein